MHLAAVLAARQVAKPAICTLFTREYQRASSLIHLDQLIPSWSSAHAASCCTEKVELAPQISNNFDSWCFVYLLYTNDTLTYVYILLIIIVDVNHFEKCSLVHILFKVSHLFMVAERNTQCSHSDGLHCPCSASGSDVQTWCNESATVAKGI